MPPKRRVASSAHDDDADVDYVPSDGSDSDSDDDRAPRAARPKPPRAAVGAKTEFTFALHARLPAFLSPAQQDLLELVPLDQVADMAQQTLSARPARLKTEADIANQFGHLTPVAAGAYGVVMQGCVRATNAPACARFSIPEGSVVAPVIVKLAWQSPRPADPRKITWPLSERGKWVAGTNATREALLGKMLSHLVTAGISPNFLGLYNVMEVTKPSPKMGDVFQTLGKLKEYLNVLRRHGDVGAATQRMPSGSALLVIAMEECVMDLNTFLSTELRGHPRATDVLQSMFCQVTAGLLAAETRYQFRHNDLHTKNVMVTSTDALNYYYRVNKQLYCVPTYGLCWKIVDYGLGASDVLFSPLDTAYVHAVSNVSVSWGLENNCNPQHAVELYDVSRLANDTAAMLHDERYPSAVQAWLKTHVDGALQRVSAGMPDFHAGKVQKCIDAAHARIRKLHGDRQRREAQAALAEGVAKTTKSHGLLQRAFETLAAGFAVKTAPSGAVVYDQASKVTINVLSFEGMFAR